MEKPNRAGLSLEEMLADIRGGKFEDESGPTWREYKAVLGVAATASANFSKYVDQVAALARRSIELTKAIAHQNKIISTQEQKIRLLEAKIRLRDIIDGKE